MEKIMVVEDERKINELIKDYLTSLGYTVIQCYNGGDAVRVQEVEKPDLLVLDLMLPGLDGLELARRIREKSEVPIIMLTARDSEADKLLGLEIGADDYMTKPFSVRELCARIKAVLRRYNSSQQEDPAMPIRHQNIELDVTRRQVLKGGANIALTQAQFELLRVLLQSPGKVFTRGDLIEAISGYKYEGYERTIDVQIKNIRKTLEEDPANPELIITVWGVGYKFQE